MMRGIPFAWRYRVTPLVAAVMLALAGCQSSPLVDDKQAVETPPPQDIVLPPPPARMEQPAMATPMLSQEPAPAAPVNPPALVALPPESPAKVAILLPLTGNTAQVGKALLNAAQLALFDFSNQSFELLVHDTKGTPEGAAEAARLAVSDGASLILGPLLAGSVRTVAPIARQAGVNVIAFSSDRSVAQPGTFVMGFLPGIEVARVASYALSRGVIRIAALAPDNAYGATVVGALRDVTARYGGVVAQVRLYDPDATDFASVVRELARYDMRKAALEAQLAELRNRDDEISRRALERLTSRETVGGLPFDALLLADGGKRLQAVAAHLPYFDIDPTQIRMLGTGQWDVPGTGAEPALLGGWYAAPDPQDRQDFVERYRQTYGEDPARIATLAYDAVALAAVLAQSETGPDFRTVAITAPEGFHGRDGIFRFLPSGPVERGLAILELNRESATVIAKAPEIFTETGF